ncbi:hypothetical protein AB833_10480 [Chromatiales bacterium (ex Bugula neritina AB1)]|nr:hypothetical protein AB833_10480 [Chromatiales bacterium (ex Bugula neritina AB1)]
MSYREPWSKKHKKVTGGLQHNFSNSFSEPLTSDELINYTRERGDSSLIDEFYSHSLEYTPNGGSLDLREEVAGLYGSRICAENILIFAGGQVALQTAAYAVLDKHSHSIVFTPGYQSVLQAPEHALSDTTIIKLHPEDQWQIDPEEVERSIKKNTRYIVTNDPFNPAGTVMKPEIQSALIEIARKHNITLLCDEAYRLLEHNESDRLPAMADLYEQGISACTMSKPWGACGITIGWLALQDLNLKQKLIDIQYFGTACPARASELQAIMTLRSGSAILKRNLHIAKENLLLLDQFMLDYQDYFDWVRPTASTVAFVNFKGPLTSTELGERLAREGISIKPSYCFTDDTSDYNNYFRIGFGEKATLSRLNELRRFMEKYKHNW